MSDDPTPTLDPHLEVARYGRKHDGDRFVGFWLALVVEGRQNRVRLDVRQTRRVVERFFSGRDVRAAVASAGAEAVEDQLRDAAAVYFNSCLTDPQYANTLWRMNRIEPGKLRDKMARDAVNALALMSDAGVLQGAARHLPILLTDGFLRAVAPHGAQELGDAVAKNPSALGAMEVAGEE